MIDLSQDVRFLKGVGQRRAQVFYKAGIFTLGDLIRFYPRDWRDFSDIVKISEVKIGQEVTFKAKVSEIKIRPTRRKRFSITEGLFSDGTGSVRALWFNQSYIAKILKKDEEVLLAGKLEDNKGLLLKNPIYERLSESETKHLGRIMSIYREVGKISSRMIRFMLKPITDKLPTQDYLPAKIKEEFLLISEKEALSQIHFPDSMQKKEKAQERLAFDEIFVPQVLGQLVRKRLREEKSYSIKAEDSFIENVYKKLSFSLTSSQKMALTHIFSDIGKNVPMNRLLEGDVGSGKTIVSAISIIAAVVSGYQAAMLVPTEVLVWEHFQNLKKFLAKFDISCELLTGSTSKKEKERIYQGIKTGLISVIVGTHALINENLEFAKLALVVLDEQHRFGVSQRKKLRQKGGGFFPHLLSMTATPIPRTFALTVYGDLDISVLSDMPCGKRQTTTYLAPQEKRQKGYDFVKKQIKSGSKVLFVCPSISFSEKMNIKAVEDEYEKLKNNEFSDYKIDMLHGKMKTDKKQKKIEDFKKGKTEIMVSTTVIEVGLNIPNLNVMVVENAERFGLAQLHQLRGRIGRKGEKSYFIMFTDSDNPNTINRLSKMEKIKDGFALAEFDLSLRGEGEIFGTRQSGFSEFKLASFSDYDLIEKAHKAAKDLVEENPTLSKYEKLRKKVYQIYKGVHAE